MLFEPLVTPSIELANRAVMAPMTRSRAVDANTPNALIAEYYGQRASAGLIIAEGTSPSPNGLGYARIPGLFNEAQVSGWKAVTDVVHAKGGKIFVQLMHTGRVSHAANLPAGAEVVGPMAEACPGEMYTDSQGMQPHTAPRAMTVADIAHAVDEYARSAQLAIEAGFDGVELHAANGYLIEQFLNANVNQRTDAYGGSIDRRNRLRSRSRVPRPPPSARTASGSGCRPTACSTAPAPTPTWRLSTWRSPRNSRSWASCTSTCWITRRWAHPRCLPI